MSAPVALITGGARRIGAATAQLLHSKGWNIVVHYRTSSTQAEQLTAQLNSQRPHSAHALAADLTQLPALALLAQQAVAQWGRLDALINNASTFYPTPVGSATAQQWDDLIGSNVKAPFFLAQELAPTLRQNAGAIINIADIHAERPLAEHPLYCIAKAGNVMLTKSLARELAPTVRVNGVAPGAIMWPEDTAELSADAKAAIVDKIALKRTGEAHDIARAIGFLLSEAPYITGQILSVDGGRTLSN
jgi:pteridine reductase